MNLILLFSLLGGVLGWLFFALLNQLFWRKGVAVFTFDGVLESLKPRLGQLIEEKFLQDGGIIINTVEKFSTSEKTLEMLKPSIAKEVAHFVDVKIDRRWPMISMLLNAKTKEKIKIELTEELMGSAPEALMKVTNSFVGKLKENHIVVHQLEQSSVEDYSQLLKPVLRPIFQNLNWIGALIGALIGLLLGIVTLFY